MIFQKGDAYFLPSFFLGETFDWIICHGVLCRGGMCYPLIEGDLNQRVAYNTYILQQMLGRLSGAPQSAVFVSSTHRDFLEIDRTALSDECVLLWQEIFQEQKDDLGGVVWSDIFGKENVPAWMAVLRRDVPGEVQVR
jgi:hypothetical protein